MTKTTAKKIAWIVFSFVLLVFLLAGSLFFYQRAYADKIYPNIYFENQSLAGLTKKQAIYLIKKQLQQVQNRQITLVAGQKEIGVKLADTGVSFDPNQIAEDSFGTGRNPNVKRRLGEIVQTVWQTKRLVAQPRLDQNKYEEFKNLIIPQLNVEAKDATLSIENGQVKETTETEGCTVELSGLPEQIIALSANPDIKILNLEVKKIVPNLKSVDNLEAKSYAEKILAKSIAFSYEDRTFSPSKNEVSKWISFTNLDNKIIASLDEGNVKAYLAQIAKSFEIQKVNRKVNAADDSIISEGKEGKYLDKDTAVSQLKTKLLSSDSVQVALATTITPIEDERVFPNEGLIPGRFPGKYIDVDLAQQKLCRINGQSIEACYTVSTGKWSTPTPIGTRYIDGKTDRAWSAKYGLWMPWWESLGGGYGIHELPEWPNGIKEGESHLGTPVSHGCIRLGVGAAQEVYNWTEIGTPVYIHK